MILCSLLFNYSETYQQVILFSKAANRDLATVLLAVFIQSIGYQWNIRKHIKNSEHGFNFFYNFNFLVLLFWKWESSLPLHLEMKTFELVSICLLDVQVNVTESFVSICIKSCEGSPIDLAQVLK